MISVGLGAPFPTVKPGPPFLAPPRGQRSAARLVLAQNQEAGRRAPGWLRLLGRRGPVRDTGDAGIIDLGVTSLAYLSPVLIPKQLELALAGWQMLPAPRPCRRALTSGCSNPELTASTHLSWEAPTQSRRR